VSEPIAVPAAGGSLAVFRLGADDGGTPPAVAVHGITSNSHAWVAVAREVPLLAIDLRGRGDSNRLPGPYGLKAHTADVLAALDHLGLERAVLTGHSLGAFIVAQFAAEHPERVASLVLVDGGLSTQIPPDVDRQALVEAGLGPALARLKLTFDSLEAYLGWWRSHPAFAGGQVKDEVLEPYAEHDLVGEAPELRSGVAEAAVRADAEDVFEMGLAANHLTVPATLLRAPRGLMNEDRPFQPAELARAWADTAPEQRGVIDVPDVNHYTLVMGARGAGVVAGAIRAALTASGRTGSR
jgi:pimeloyl-ACP methyl ester carboxylesterase